MTSFTNIFKGHGRIEKRRVSTAYCKDSGIKKRDKVALVKKTG